MFEFLLILLLVSLVALVLSFFNENEIGIFLGAIGLVASIVLWFIYGLFVGFSALITGLFSLVTSMSLGGGVAIVGIAFAIVVYVCHKKKSSRG